MELRLGLIKTIPFVGQPVKILSFSSYNRFLYNPWFYCNLFHFLFTLHTHWMWNFADVFFLTIMSFLRLPTKSETFLILDLFQQIKAR